MVMGNQYHEQVNLQNRGILILLVARTYAIIVFCVSLFVPSKKEVVVFGGFAMIKYARWSEALNQIGINSITLVPSVQAINNDQDWDKTWLSTCPKLIRGRRLRRVLAPAFAWFWVLRHARVTCSPVGGISFFTWVGLDRLEIWLLKKRGIHTVAICGGGDAYALGSIKDSSLRHALQSSYPDRARIHRQITKTVRIWEERADIYVADKMVCDGMARSDLISPHIGVVDPNALKSNSKLENNLANGKKRPVIVLHATNHRYFKGTEFIQEAVASLRKDGYKIDFHLVEGMKNSELLRLVADVDIVIDQIIMPGYANFAIESMALGKSVICNLEPGDFRNLMTRYSFLNKCPAVSASPETVRSVLEELILNPQKRIELGHLGIQYVREYHSYESWQNLWRKFETAKFDGDQIVRDNIFHPLNKC